MRITCSPTELTQALNTVQRGTSGKTILPILSGVLWEVGETACILKATDLEMGIAVNVPANIAEPGRVVLPARLLGDMVRSFTGTEVTLEVDDNLQATLTCGSSYLELMGMPADQFPQLETGETAVQYEVEPKLLLKISRQVGLAWSREDTRGIFNGILWEDAGDGQVTWVATDMYRIAWYNQELPRFGSGALRVVLPGRVFTDIGRLAADVDNPVQVELGNTLGVFRLGGITVSCRMLGGQYPNYDQVIPNFFSTRLVVSREDFFKNLERAALMAREEEDKARMYLVTLDIGPEAVQVAAQASHLGRFQDMVPATLEGPPGTVIFNVRYLLDGVRAFASSEELVINFTPEFGHAVITASGEAFSYLVLPVKLE